MLTLVRIGREFMLSVATRTSRQRFREERIIPDKVVTRLQEKWGLSTRRVFVKAYRSHYGAQAFQSKASWSRVAQDYLDYCHSWHRWLPYYVLREHELV